MSRYVYRNLQATEISKLPGTLIRRLHLADSIHSDIIYIATGSLFDEKRLT